MLKRKKRFRLYLLHTVDKQLYFHRQSLKYGRKADNIADLQAYPLCLTNTLHLGIYLKLLPVKFKTVDQQLFHDFTRSDQDSAYIRDVIRLKDYLKK